MTKKVALSVIFIALLVADTAHFGVLCAAGFVWLRGERAMFRNDLKRAWQCYEQARRWGANTARLETDMAQLLLMGLDELAAGVPGRLPESPENSLREAFLLVGRRISSEPFNAYSWSQAADLYVHAAARRRQGEILDLSRLSENPMDNLLPEDRLGLAAQEIATRMEPNNYLYYDLLADLYMDHGSPESAAPYRRRSIAAAPDTRLHTYLDNPDLPGVILEAALQGFEDASGRPSMIAKGFMLGEAARMLAWHGDDRRAVPILQRAIEADPDLADAVMQLADANYRLKNYLDAITYSIRAAQMAPEQPWPHQTAGLSYLALGKLEPAIEEFTKARDLRPQEMRFFLLLGEALESTGRVKDAERQFVAAANRNPAVADAWASLLAFYVRQHDHGAVLEVCSKLAGLSTGTRTYEEECASLEGSR